MNIQNINDNYKYLITIYGQIKTKDIVFVDAYDVLSKIQQIILSIIENSINRKIIEKHLDVINSYHPNIIWLFDKNTVIAENNEQKDKSKLFLFYIIVSIINAFILIVLYKKNNYIGMGILVVLTIAIIGLVIAYQKLHLFGCRLTNTEKDNMIIENNTQDFKILFNTIQDVYDFDIYMTKEKKKIRDNLNIFKSIMDKKNGLQKINLNPDKYSKMLTKILEYIGMIDIYISISKLIFFDNYVMPEYIKPDYKNINICLEIVGNYKLKFDKELRVLYAVGNFDGRNKFVDDILNNIYCCQTLGVCRYSQIKFTPFTAILDKEIDKIQDIIDIVDNREGLFLVIITLTHEMNHYFMELLKKIVKYNNIILILSFDAVINELEIDKYILKEF